MLGGVFLYKGHATRSEILAALADEQVTATIDGVEVPVNSQATAQNQADVIRSHTLERYGPWQTIPGKLEDGSANPVRQTFLNGLTLRNSLYMARMGLGGRIVAVPRKVPAHSRFSIRERPRYVTGWSRQA